ncbi:hypothetical protein J422_02829 [Methanocaldococcus villosus KIN24-T80]|uniref:MIP18 family-like domain-containing protein n=1 Tax=Methanocaldococcus villosus KIN24-T80 TaxID=1069083 RepID=N6UVJ8_9EURY|nr:metal-sulfur cluster assembly factor [Methanocaldococcus villosus]ENN96374.1 hypothetical protein J422_02829 [Methanocaldococcus villosus KIN24-T80]
MVSKEDVIKALRKVQDPHMGISIVDMGLVRDIEIDDNGNVKFIITPTNPACMSVLGMAMQAKKVVEELEGVKKVDVKVEGHFMEKEINEMLNEP